MAISAHVELVHQGVDAVNRHQTKGIPLDLSGADLSTLELRDINLQRANLRGANLTQATLSGADLSHSQCAGARFVGANLQRASFQKASLEGADFTGANLADGVLRGANMSEVILRSARLPAADLLEANLEHANLKKANLSRANLGGAHLSNSNLSLATLFKASLQNANVLGADLTGADLDHADLQRTDFENAVLRNANFDEANVSAANFRDAIGVTHAHNLDKVRIDRDAQYLETVKRDAINRWLDWERLRTLGRLPLFGASYTVLLLIPVFIFTLATYNRYVVGPAQAFAVSVREAVDSDRSTHTELTAIAAASAIEEHVAPLAIPSQSLLILLSTFLLAIGSSIYVLFCPSRVKEFTRDQWCDQLGKSLLHYWPITWKHRMLRIVCASCYGVGGIGAAWVIVVKVLRAGRFIYENSRFSLW